MAVVGIGGVGSWAAEALARSGVGALTLIDLDHVAESNINRQIHALDATVGQAKVQAMRERIAQIHPRLPGAWRRGLRRAGQLARAAAAPVDAVIDACDQVKAKVAHGGLGARAQAHALHRRGAAGGKRLAHKVDIDDLAHTTHDPLLAQLRYRLRKFHGAPREGKRIGVPCVFSREAVAPPDASCAHRGRRLAQLPRLRLGGERHRHLRPVRRRLGSRHARAQERVRKPRYNRGLCCLRAAEKMSVGR